MALTLSANDIDFLKDTAIRAGQQIMEVYGDENQFTQVEYKDDDSPLTKADHKSHVVIDQALRERFAQIPILSEEGKMIGYEERKNWNTCWLVDPLDGTKEFIKRNGEFTVNIALIEEGKTLFGVIYLPAKDILYWGGSEYGAFKQEGNSSPLKLAVNNRTEDLIAVSSRSHTGSEDEEMLAQFSIKDAVNSGSSIKFCLVAEGTADIYYRGKPTMEWDTAAGQAIVEGAGGVVLAEAKEPLKYNREVLRNPAFLCKGF